MLLIYCLYFFLATSLTILAIGLFFDLKKEEQESDEFSNFIRAEELNMEKEKLKSELKNVRENTEKIRRSLESGNR